MRDDVAPGPSTQASGPLAPGRLGREDARNFRVWTPSALVPAPQLLLSPLEVWLAADEPHLGSPYGRAGARIVSGYGEWQAGPHGIEVEEEGDRDAEVRSQQRAASRPEIGGHVGEHERQRQ